MARMKPSRVAPNASGAEKKVFRAFEEALGDGWTVTHGARWLYRPRRGADRAPAEVEADFFLGHVDFGALILEVKGGEVRYDSNSGRWVSRSRAGQLNEIKDPAAQAQRAVHSLLRWLHEHPAMPRVGPIGHAVAFPDGVAATGALPNLPKEILFVADDFADPDRLRQKVERASSYWTGKDRGSWTAKTLTAVSDLIAPDFEIISVLSTTLDEADQAIVRLSEQQFETLNQLARASRVAVAGCAGSGKTMLAAEQATNLAAHGFRVLLVCYNQLLADHLADRLADIAGLDVLSFHRLCAKLAREAEIPIREDDSQTFWEHDLPAALVDAIDRVGPVYDAVIADEGQDFAEAWWLALQTLLEDPDEGRMFVFYDDNQQLYERPRGLPDRMFPYQLTENWRNTRPIYTLVSRYYEGPATRGLGPDGPAVETVKSSPRTLSDDLERLLKRLISVGMVGTSDIVILVPGSVDGSGLAGAMGDFWLTDTPRRNKDVRLESIRRFKGLESKVVILIQARDEQSSERELMYVASSRARTHLVVVQVS